MKLTEIRIQNFRSFQDQTVYLDDYTCFVGPNGSGKSTILMALNVFFRENGSTVTDVCTLAEEDFHHKNTKDPIRITVTFEQLSEAAQREFRHYFRRGKLVIFAQALWDPGSRSAAVKHYGSRLVMRAFAPYFEADEKGAKADELKTIYVGIRGQFSDLPQATTKPAMVAALRGYEEGHADQCELIDEPNQFYGFTRGDYHLENHIQWVYVPAVKDASTEQEEGSKTALGQLLARTVRTKLNFSEAIQRLKDGVEEKYQEILAAQEDALKSLGLSMEKRLRDYVDARAQLDLKWSYDSKKSIAINDPVAKAFIGDGGFVGEVARAGHGLQRGFLVTVLHELAGSDDQGGPTLLLGFEEPELYQHPPQARHLANVLERLSDPQNNSQIVVTTHSPYFISSKGFENVRMVRKCQNRRKATVCGATYKALESRLSTALKQTPGSPSSLMARIGQILQPSQSELFFTSVAIFVEGPEDVAFISTQFELSKRMVEFRSLGCHFITAGGKANLSRLAAIAQELEIPHFVIFDADGDEAGGKDVDKHKKDNESLIRLCSLACDKVFPDAIVWKENVVMWPTNIQKIVSADVGEKIWNEAQESARQQHDLTEGVKAKNQMLVAYTLQELADRGVQSSVLIRLCGSILQFAEKVQLA